MRRVCPSYRRLISPTKHKKERNTDPTPATTQTVREKGVLFWGGWVGERGGGGLLELLFGWCSTSSSSFLLFVGGLTFCCVIHFVRCLLLLFCALDRSSPLLFSYKCYMYMWVCLRRCSASFFSFGWNE